MNYQLLPKAAVTTQRIRRRRIVPGYRFPSVSIFLPFNPKMEMKKKLTHALSKATNIVATELNNRYPGEMSLLVIQKLKAIIRNLNFNTHRKSIAIFVSPVFEKIYYHNMDVEEKIIVNESLRIGDLVYSKKQSRKFHILSLRERESRIFLSETNSSVKITKNSPVSKNAWQKGSSDGITNFSDDLVMEEFLHHVDHSLDKMVKNDMLPVFVMGNENLIEQFKNITKNNEAVIEYVYGDCEKCSLEELTRILKAHVIDWHKIKQKNLLHQMKKAASKKELSLGIEQVNHEAISRRVRLLLIEEQSLYDAGLWESSQNYKTTLRYNKFSCIKNPTDEIIEKVLENGGDVELVNNGLLGEYSHIALIKD